MTASAYPNFKTHFIALLDQAARTISPPEISFRIELTRTKQANHGDYSCNLAMQLAKPMHKSPREIASLLIEALPPSPHLHKVEVAGAGFINLFLTRSSAGIRRTRQGTNVLFARPRIFLIPAWR